MPAAIATTRRATRHWRNSPSAKTRRRPEPHRWRFFRVLLWDCLPPYLPLSSASISTSPPLGKSSRAVALAQRACPGLLLPSEFML
jgi:hypothetical protein